MLFGEMSIYNYNYNPTETLELRYLIYPYPP